MNTANDPPPIMPISASWLALAATVLLGWLLYLLAPILTPFAFAALLSYMGDPLADSLEERGFSRSIAVVLVFTAMILSAVFFVLLIVPMLENQISSLITKMPGYIDWMQEKLSPLIERYLGTSPELLDFDRLIAMLKENWSKAGGIVSTILGSVSHSGLAFIGWIMNVVLVPVVTFYLLRDWDIFMAHIRHLLPRRIEPTVCKLAAESNEVLGEFVRGQIMVMVGLGSIYAIGLWIVGLDLALLIGMGAGLVSFVSYLGSILGLAAALLVALFQFQDIIHIVFVLMVFGVGQSIEGMVLTPLLVGDKVGLHPVAVIFAVLAGGQLFGFLGILLALPTASVIMVLLRHAYDIYENSSFYHTGMTQESPETDEDEETALESAD